MALKILFIIGNAAHELNLKWYIIDQVKFILQCTVKPVFKGHLNIREKVSLHDRCPFITGSLTWGR